MLVVSRKQNQSVVFPTLGIRVEILRMAGKTVRVGVEAPEEIQILRGELIDTESSSSDDSMPGKSKADDASSSERAKQEQHDLRNRLNRANLAMKLLQKQLSMGQIDDAESSLSIALKTFDEMEQAVAAPNQKTTGTASGLMSTGSTEATSSSPKRALLVEDDPNERALLAAYLKASGYEVDTAEDGQAALDYLSDQKPDAVVMDMEMPRLNGHDCVREIRNDYQFDDMKIFIVSGMEQRAAKVDSGDRGVQRWFQKPLNPEDLIDELSTSLN